MIGGFSGKDVNIMIGSCTVTLQLLSNYNFAGLLQQNTVPIIYEEIAVVMINVLKRRKWHADQFFSVRSLILMYYMWLNVI